MRDIIWTLVLILSPVELPCSTGSEDSWQTLKAFAWVTQLSGPRCIWTNSFRSEVQWVRDRWRRNRDCPSIYDCDGLPNLQICLNNYREAKKTLSWMEKAKTERLHWQDQIDSMIPEIKAVIDIWLEAANAQDKNIFWCSRRESLDRLRLLLGEEDYKYWTSSGGY